MSENQTAKTLVLAAKQADAQGHDLSNEPALNEANQQKAKALNIAALASQYGLGHDMQAHGQGQPYGIP
jgi:hypothetical protein